MFTRNENKKMLYSPYFACKHLLIAMGKVIETVADSIAIEILNENAILTGKGNELHLYRRNVKEENVFVSQVLDTKLTNKIHGIKKTLGEKAGGRTLLVYGEKEFILVAFNNNYEFDEFYRADLSDWISCGCFINNGNQEEFVLLTAHSIILRFSFDTLRKECVLKERVSCMDKSTLYCAHLYGETWHDLLVFAGNAFGELLIWQPKKSKENESVLKPKLSPLIQRISAHNGVIFSIDYDQDTQCLITTSDDRAIKWWKVDFKGENKNDWNETVLQAMSSGYGHVARVFQGRIIKDGGQVYALSVGEDSYFCLWHKSGELLFKRRQQYGATIWNFAYDSKTKTIYTIGSIGNLVGFGLTEVLKETQQLIQTESLLPALEDGKSAEYIAKVKFLNENLLIGITNQNRLKLSKHQEVDNKWHDWQPIDVKVDFKCTVMEVYENRVALSGYKRFILLEYLNEREEFITLYDKELLQSVIRCVVFFNRSNYLVCDDQGNCNIFTETIDARRTLILPKCKEPWLTSAVQLNHQRHMVISNRQGNLLLYRFIEDNNNYELMQTIKHPHGNLGATNLHCLEECTTTASIRSTGHDGALNYFSVDFKDSAITVCRRQIIPVAWLEHIEKGFNDVNLFLGFNDNHFVVWCKENDFLLQLPCGGGHRCWHFVINSRDYYISLAFIKNKRVRYHKLPLLNRELTNLPLAKRWHIAPCNIMQILPKDNLKFSIAVTAGDDNLIKIHLLKPNGLNEQLELHHHISNIRALKLLTLNKHEFLIFSGGGRAQLCVTKVNNLNFHIKEMINYTLKPFNEQNATNGKSSYNFDPETRLMSVDVKQLNNFEYQIYVGCSDGFLRLLHLNLQTTEVQVIKQYFYKKCILQVRYINELDYILVAATDGILKFYDSQLTDCVYQLPHHTSGVNGLAVLYNVETSCLHILTGGDDQAVAYSALYITKSEFKMLKQFHHAYLHTAQVCACALSSSGLHGFTSGVDQVLNKIDLLTGEVVDSFYSCVADIKGVALANDNTCLLYGCGLQIYAFN